MLKKEISKTEARKRIESFFLNLNQKSSKKTKQIKNLAMRNKISLRGYKKLFCKKCLIPYSFPKIRIKNKMKIIGCRNCGFVSRYKFFSSS
jgi:RNase P subunit RPR2